MLIEGGGNIQQVTLSRFGPGALQLHTTPMQLYFLLSLWWGGEMGALWRAEVAETQCTAGADIK